MYFSTQTQVARRITESCFLNDTRMLLRLLVVVDADEEDVGGVLADLLDVFAVLDLLDGLLGGMTLFQLHDEGWLVHVLAGTEDEVGEAVAHGHLAVDDVVYALDKLFFNLCPQNVCIEDIFLKCSSLNDFYSTNIFDVHSVAKHILSLNIDERLRSGDISLVHDISHVRVGAKKEDRVFYSFATKYCSHHQPMKFAIFDNYVEKVLWHFQKKDKFSSFKR